MKFIILSSSRGTTFQSVIDRMNDGSLTATCIGLITDKTERGCIEKAKAASLPYRVVEADPKADREKFDHAVHNAITELITSQCDPTKNQKLLSAEALERSGRAEAEETKNESVMNSNANEITEKPILAEMGWMWIHTPWFIEKHVGKILNVHPALLPKHGGKGMYGHHVHDSVLKSGDTESGMTIHVMDSGVDTGKTLLQKTCPVLSDDDASTLQERVQELEKEWYPKLLQMIEVGEIVL